MSISNVAASAPNPALMALLAQLNGSSEPSAFAQPAASTGSAGATSNSLTGSGSASLSNEILGLLHQMRQHVSAGGGTSASSTTSSTSASTLSSPLDQLMSSLDANLSASQSTSTMVSPLQQLFSSMDAGDDGSDSEFPGAIANGANGTGASGGFLGLHGGGSGSLTTASLTQVWENLQNSPGSAAASLLDAFAKANIGAATTSISV